MKGLTTAEAIESRRRYGNNKIDLREDRVLLSVLKGIFLEPMFIFLLAACLIYFFADQYQEGFIMGVAIFIVTGISLFQEYRSRNAIHALKKISTSKATVIRNGSSLTIPDEDIVVDDLLLISEGEIVPADGKIIVANDLSLNEAVLTGEAFSISKIANDEQLAYKGSLVTSGSATIKVSAVGTSTLFGKIGLSLKEITVLKTPLQEQIRSFVRNMAWIGLIAFLFVVGFNYYQSGNFMNAIMQGLTLAMSILPEEIPVAFSTFLALGALRLLKSGMIVKQPQYVETLGAATVICTDKTGTLTLNSMDIEWFYDKATHHSINREDIKNVPVKLVEYAMWASETDPFDPMEKSIHAFYSKIASTDKRAQFTQVHEYALGGKPALMTHIFRSNMGETVIAAKGAPEAIIKQSNLSIEETKKITEQAQSYAEQGYRVLAVGEATWNEKPFPESQQTFLFQLIGLLAFYDPPKANIYEAIKTLRSAGINIKMITGDYPVTALAIAKQIDLADSYNILTGDAIVSMNAAELEQKVKDTSIFARMYPEAKLKVIEALKANGDIVAMTGDGVNDAPALKAAHIGIAMGQRGSEVAKAAASLILVDDDIGHMVEAVEQGRKIYSNLKKAIQYIVSIHIPIILIVILPLILRWKFDNIFSPVHVIFLELIMGPTCSIIYENEPIEPGAMLLPPRKMSSSFLSGRQLLISIAQGLAITMSCLGIGYYYLMMNYDDQAVRTIIFTTLLFSNVLLTLVNRSFYYSVFKTLKYKNNLMILMILVNLLSILAFLCLPFMQHLFLLTTINATIIFTCFVCAAAGTLWVEIIKRYAIKKG